MTHGLLKGHLPLPEVSVSNDSPVNAVILILSLD